MKSLEQGPPGAAETPHAIRHPHLPQFPRRAHTAGSGEGTRAHAPRSRPGAEPGCESRCSTALGLPPGTPGSRGVSRGSGGGLRPREEAQSGAQDVETSSTCQGRSPRAQINTREMEPEHEQTRFYHEGGQGPAGVGSPSLEILGTGPATARAPLVPASPSHSGVQRWGVRPQKDPPISSHKDKRHRLRPFSW